MTIPVKPQTLFFPLMALVMSSCFFEDPGPRQEMERHYTVVDFDRLEMGSGLRIDVEHGDFFSVTATGDRRNIEDLIVDKEGSTLVIRYDHHRERRHDTFIRITMPELNAVTFSGGSDSHVTGFSTDEPVDIYLSGGSVCQLGVNAPRLNVVLSGASYLKVRGNGDIMDADVSGASALKAFNFPVATADLTFSGASDGEATVSERLHASASGASHLVYRGDPSVSIEVSGSSLIHRE